MARYTDKTMACVVVGFPGAGKTTTSEIIVETLEDHGTDAFLLETGDIVREGAAEYFDEDPSGMSSDQLGEYSTMRRKQDGGDYVIQDVFETLEDDEQFPEAVTVISGARDTGAIDKVGEYFDYLEICWVHAPFETRLERLQGRGRNGEDTFTEDDLKRRDGRESSWGTPEWAFVADHTLNNDKDVENLREQIRYLWWVGDLQFYPRRR